MRRKLFVLCQIGMFILLSGSGFCQKVVQERPYRDAFLEAYDNYQNKNYALSFEQFSTFIEAYCDNDNAFLQDAFFFKAAASCQMMNNDADALLLSYINRYPQSLHTNDAYFLLANFYTQNNQYDKALSVYRQMNTSVLDQEKKYEYAYKYGHSLFMQGNYDEALIEFDKVKDAKSKYAAPSTYFYAHILYEQKKYNLALKEFLTLQNDKSFGKIVPFYIAHIYYYQQNYEELIKIAPDLSEKSQSKKSYELNRMLGDTYYKLGRYKEAIPYLEKTAQEAGADAQDYYLLGFTLTEEKNFEKAKRYLASASEKKDSLGQNALYHLGICLLETDNRSEAQAMFKEASELDFDMQVKENALLNYAKLSYETSPAYNESVKAFQLFADSFPNSAKANEAKEYLAQLYGDMKNYRDAIEMIEQMSERNLSVNRAYQRLCLNRAIELFNENRLDDALIYLDKSLSQAHDNSLTATAYYLKAEAYYQMGEYDLSIKNLNTFYASSGSDKSPFLPQADYAMGYNLFKQKKYSSAEGYFQRAIGKLNAQQNTDATLRYADCLYMGKRFRDAIAEYGKIIKEKHQDFDYATYQTAMAYGALGNYARKKEILEQANNDFTSGSYVASMKYELANTYLTLEENKTAISTYQNVIEKYPQSIHVKDCYAKIGMIYYKLGDDQKALVYLDKLVKMYPESEEARTALGNIKAIYVDANKVDDFIAYTKSIPSASISVGEQDSISYQAIENLYMDGDCPNAIAGFKNYLNKYPDGAFFVSANYYLADCLNKINQKQEALQHYENIVSKPKNVFTEKSLLKAAEINFEEKNYDKAKQYYSQLEKIAEITSNKLQAIDGQMQSCFELGQADTAIICANKLLSLDKLDESARERANYILAKSLLLNQNSGQAIEEFKRLTKAKNPEYAAEAQYVLAEIAFNSGKIEESEKMIHQINANPSSEYWLAKTFVLWADIFKSKGNTIQAKQTLQSIIDNYEGDEELIELAKQKLISLTDEETKTLQETEDKRQEQQEAVDEIIIEDAEQ